MSGIQLGIEANLSDEIARLRAENEHLLEENGNLNKELHQLENKYARVLIEGTQKEQPGRPMQLLHNAQDGIFFSNVSGEVVFINPYLSGILGLGADEKKLVGKPLPLEVWDDRAELASINEDLSTYGQIRDRLVIMRHQRSGERVYISLSSVAVRDPYGKMIGAQHVLCNITSKMRIAEELRVRTQFLVVLTNFVAMLKGNTDLDKLLSESLVKLLEALGNSAYSCIYLKRADAADPTLVAEQHNKGWEKVDASEILDLARQVISSAEQVTQPLSHPRKALPLVGVPMMVGGSALGALLIAEPSDRIYSESDMEMLNLIASELALAVEYNWLRAGVRH
jgi:PAS domain S-box-containing protein